MPVDFLQKQEAGQPSRHCRASSGDPDALAVKRARGGGDLQPKAEFAADSLQISHWRLFDAIVDCARALRGGPTTGLGGGRPLFKPGASSGCSLSSV